MTEKLTFDTKIAEQAVANYDNFKEAVDSRKESLRTIEINARLGELASTGRFGKSAAKKESAALKAEFATLGREADGTPAPNFPRSFAENPAHDAVVRDVSRASVERALDTAAKHYQENNGAYQDIATVEANNQFINQRSPERIMVPDALQELANNAAAMSEAHQPPVAEQATPAVNVHKAA